MKILTGDALTQLRTLESGSVDCVVTSPPYWSLRDYGQPGQLGLEPTFEQYIDALLQIFDEVRRVLKPTGTCWVNLGDTYANTWNGGHKGSGSTLNGTLPPESASPRRRTKQSVGRKCLAQIPERFAIGMTARGWILRNELIWHKPNCMPASVTDRFTVDHEKMYFFTKGPRYFFDQQFEPSKDPEDDVRRMTKARTYSRERQGGNATFNSPQVDEAAARERMQKGRNKRTVWRVSTTPYKGAHFAVYPEQLIRTPIRAGCPLGGTVLDPFMGSGTTLAVAAQEGREAIGIELNPEYVALAQERLSRAAKRAGHGA